MFSKFDVDNIGSLLHALLKKFFSDLNIDIHSHEASLIEGEYIKLDFSASTEIENFPESLKFDIQGIQYHVSLNITKTSEQFNTYCIVCNDVELLKILKNAICHEVCLWLNGKLAYVPNIENMQWKVDETTGNVIMKLPPRKSTETSETRRAACRAFWENFCEQDQSNNPIKNTRAFNGRAHFTILAEEKSVVFTLDDFSLQDLHQLVLNKKQSSIHPKPKELKDSQTFTLYLPQSLSQSEFSTVGSFFENAPDNKADASQLLDDLGIITSQSQSYHPQNHFNS